MALPSVCKEIERIQQDIPDVFGLAWRLNLGMGVELSYGRMFGAKRSLKQDFPDVFGLAVDPSAMVVSNFLILRGGIVWSLVLRRDLFD